MSDTAGRGRTATTTEILERIRVLAPGFRDRAAAADTARRIPEESARELLDAGIARILIPPRFGGYGLGLDTLFEVVREIGKADASHAWCAALMIHHPHYVGQYPEAAQEAVWTDGPDVAIAASLLPYPEVTPVEGGYRISGKSPFASGIMHSSWVALGGMLVGDAGPEWTFFLVPPGEYTVEDTWFAAGMRGTGSNTVVTDDVFVPAERTMRLSDIIEGKAPGGKIHEKSIFRTPFITYAPLTFVTPMLGAAQGAYEDVRDWTRTRRGAGGVVLAELPNMQVRLARAAADLDAAELLIRRAVDVAMAETPAPPELRARSMRDYARASELCVSAIDGLVAMAGAGGFTETHPVQRAWRDIHFSAMHISLNPDLNYAHFGRLELGLPRDPHQPFY